MRDVTDAQITAGVVAAQKWIEAAEGRPCPSMDDAPPEQVEALKGLIRVIIEAALSTSAEASA